MEHQLYQALQGLGILTILFFCFIIAASVETGRENDARRARAKAERETERRDDKGDDGARDERETIAQPTPESHPDTTIIR